MSLAGNSPFTKPIRHGSFVNPPEGFIAALHQELNQLAQRDRWRLPLDTLKIQAARGSFVRRHREHAEHAVHRSRSDPGRLRAGRSGHDLLVNGAALRTPQDYCGQAIAIEPGTRPRGDLQAVLDGCGLGSCLQALPYRSANDMAHGTALLSQPPWSGTATTTVTTEGETVDVRSFDELDLPPADLIKVDVEGCEAASCAARASTSHAIAPR
jgi:hypothetical protein